MSGNIENLGNGVSRQWDDTLNAVIFVLENTNRAAVNTYIEGNLETLRHWDKSKTLYTIQNISSKEVNLTPYLCGRLTEISEYVKQNQISVATAIVMENNFTGQVMRLFGRIFTINARYLTQVYFTDFASARSWVTSQQKKAN